MRSALVLLASIVAGVSVTDGARADDPPAGTVSLTLHEGESRALVAPGGARVTCDDPAVARGDIVDDSFVLVAGHAGRTLCGVTLAGLPRGLYLVTVVAGAAKK